MTQLDLLDFPAVSTIPRGSCRNEKTASDQFSKVSDFNYPDRPGFKARETSRDAGDAMASRAKTLRDAAYSILKASAGLTADEVADALRESVLAIRPRCSELAARSKILDSGLRRPNKSGRKAVVWIVSPQVT